jgi:hypothetical protein
MRKTLTAMLTCSIGILAQNKPTWLPPFPNNELGITKSSSVKEIVEYFMSDFRKSDVRAQALPDGLGTAIRVGDDKVDCLVRVHETPDGPTFVDAGCTPHHAYTGTGVAFPANYRAPHYSAFKKSEFDQIHTGMSYDEVTSILGSGEVLSTSAIAGHVTTIYGWKNGDGSNMNVMIQDNRVVSKAQAGLR